MLIFNSLARIKIKQTQQLGHHTKIYFDYLTYSVKDTEIMSTNTTNLLMEQVIRVKSKTTRKKKPSKCFTNKCDNHSELF